MMLSKEDAETFDAYKKMPANSSKRKHIEQQISDVFQVLDENCASALPTGSKLYELEAALIRYLMDE